MPSAPPFDVRPIDKKIVKTAYGISAMKYSAAPVAFHKAYFFAIELLENITVNKILLIKSIIILN